MYTAQKHNIIIMSSQFQSKHKIINHEIQNITKTPKATNSIRMNTKNPISDSINYLQRRGPDVAGKLLRLIRYGLKRGVVRPRVDPTVSVRPPCVQRREGAVKHPSFCIFSRVQKIQRVRYFRLRWQIILIVVFLFSFSIPVISSLFYYSNSSSPFLRGSSRSRSRFAATFSLLSHRLDGGINGGHLARWVRRRPTILSSFLFNGRFFISLGFCSG